MGFLRDAFLSITMLLAGATAGSAASRPGEVVQAPVVVAGSSPTATTIELEPPHRDGIGAAPEWNGATQDAPPAPLQVVEYPFAPPPAPTLEDALAASPWPPHLWPQLIAIARCESGLDPLAVGDHGRAYGLMQVRVDYNPRLAARHDLFTYEGALAAAWELYAERGSFAAWSCAR